MAVSAEVQGVAVLLPVWVAAAQLKVHLLPLQVTFIRHHQALSDLQGGENSLDRTQRKRKKRQFEIAPVAILLNFAGEKS